jgi:hypothetical protein
MNLRFSILLLALTLAIAVGCGSDPDTPLGSDFMIDGLIDSEPGETFQDTIRITSGDVAFVTGSTITGSATMTIGRKDDVESAMLIRFDFSPAGSDTLRIVDRAVLTLRMINANQTGSFNAEFFELLSPFAEGDSITTADISTMPIPDSSGTVTNRVMQFFPSTYTLPTDLVQDWIRGDQDHNGIAMSVDDPMDTLDLEYGTRHNGDESLQPFLQVFFTDQTSTSYRSSAGGTLVNDLSTTTKLRLSDGVTRRIFVPVDLSTFNPEDLLHDGRLVFKIVEDSWSGGDNIVELYAPDSDVPGDPGLLVGTFVVGALIDPEAGQLELPARGILAKFLIEPETNHGLVLRFSLEGSAIRRIDFHTSTDHDSLKPFLDLTFSDAPTFPRSTP